MPQDVDVMDDYRAQAEHIEAALCIDVATLDDPQHAKLAASYNDGVKAAVAAFVAADRGAVQERDDLRAMLVARGEDDRSIAAELALIAVGRTPDDSGGR